MRNVAVIVATIMCLASVVMSLARNRLFSSLPIADHLRMTNSILGLSAVCFIFLVLSFSRKHKRPVAVLLLVVFLVTTINFTVQCTALVQLKEDEVFHEGSIPVAWMRKVTLQDVDRELGNWEPWLKTRSLVLQNDEIWFFSTPKRYWNSLNGLEGYIVIREGVRIAAIRTKIS